MFIYFNFAYTILIHMNKYTVYENTSYNYLDRKQELKKKLFTIHLEGWVRGGEGVRLVNEVHQNESKKSIECILQLLWTHTPLALLLLQFFYWLIPYILSNLFSLYIFSISSFSSITDFIFGSASTPTTSLYVSVMNPSEQFVEHGISQQVLLFFTPFFPCTVLKSLN